MKGHEDKTFGDLFPTSPSHGNTLLLQDSRTRFIQGHVKILELSKKSTHPEPRNQAEVRKTQQKNEVKKEVKKEVKDEVKRVRRNEGNPKRRKDI